MAVTVALESYPGNLINNEFVKSSTTRHGIDPSTEDALWEVPVATREDLDKAVEHARSAFKTWSQTTWSERAALVRRYADAVEANRAVLEKISLLETGKPLAIAKQEVDTTVGTLRALAGLELKDEVLTENDDRIVYSTRTPLGVCAAIVPWNWPQVLGAGKIASALLTGNCVIVKPSPFTPYGNLKLGEVGKDIFPPGVLQVLSGDDDLGPWITSHPDIDMVSFTGSIPTGKRVAASCAKTLKRYTLELGGNDAAIVCGDVEIEKCLPKIASLAFLHSGQICMDVKRLYIHESIYDKFRDAMVSFVKDNFKMGDPRDQATFLGPIQNRMQFEKVKDLYSQIDKQGWKAALKGDVPNSKGFFANPAIIDNPPDDSRIVTEEPFGPIMPLLQWSDEKEVLERANGLETGLGASVWSKDVKRAERMARQLSAGSVWVNSHLDLEPTVPFSGHKLSGFGVELGVDGLKEFTNHRSLWVWKKVFD